MRRMRGVGRLDLTLKALSIGILALYGVTACGSSSAGGASAQDASVGVSDTVPPPDPSAAATNVPFTPAHTWVISSKADDGSTWTATLAAGSLVHGAAVTSAVDPALLTACDVSPTTDAVIPFTLQKTSTTSGGFSAQAATEFKVTAGTFVPGSSPTGSGSTATFKIGVEYSDGPDCDAPDDTGGFNTSGMLAPGQSTIDRGVFVLHNWASPTYPTGDPSFLPDIWLGVPGYAVLTDAQWLNLTVAGPHVTDLRNTSSGETGPDSHLASTYWEFPLDGVSKADCSYIPVYVYTEQDIREKCAAQN